ncbi:Developmentally-regulated G-protein 3 [Lathyrus oleraceus]|uniref:Developmentally-regulated G-protein 3 n=2 Tax=IRL clade TaxID=2233839 RepID=A0A9D4WLR8_PEA|nr:Developmentally-regulated G-protein 3 [Pisum sativum]
MDSDNSDNNDQEFWALVEEEFMDDSDEEQQLQNSGSSSRRKRRTTIDRGREEGHNRLFNDYFSKNPVYTDVQFRRRFRMHRHVFLRIVDALGNYDEYFQMRVDATGKMGLSPLQKCTTAIRMLAYGSPADLVDEYVRIGESTSIECLQRFVKGVNVVFGAEYLRKPNNTDVEHLLQMGESRGFPDGKDSKEQGYCSSFRVTEGILIDLCSDMFLPTTFPIFEAKLAKLRRELLTPTTKGGGGAGEGFDVTKSGDARVGLVGFPSVGKSTLLNKLTGTFSEVASYEFTTLTCIPGVITYRGAKIQLLDLPGIIEGAKDGKGRGRQVISTARTCNCILIVLDAIKPITHKRLIEKELEGFGIRLNKEPPNLTFRRKEKGGINFTSTATNTHLDLDTVKAICSEYRIHNADITLRYDATADDLIDVIEGSRIYTPCIYVVNKIDQITLEELEILDKLPHYCPVSAHLEWNLDGLLDKVWEYLCLTRIYTKPKGMNPDYEDPVILSSKKKTVEDFCDRIHKDMLKQFKYALVWGSSAKHKPQRVGKVDSDSIC